VDKVETCKEMVLRGLGYGIVPNFLLEAESPELLIKKLTDLDDQIILRKLWMFYHTHDMNLSVVKAFVNFYKEYILTKSPK